MYHRHENDGFTVQMIVRRNKLETLLDTSAKTKCLQYKYLQKQICLKLLVTDITADV
jgi:hypothetical protein